MEARPASAGKCEGSKVEGEEAMRWIVFDPVLFRSVVWMSSPLSALSLSPLPYTHKDEAFVQNQH